MKIEILFTLILIILLSISTSIQKDNKKDNKYDLIQLNEINFHNKTNLVDHFLLLIHNPWCKFSQNLEKKLVSVNQLLEMENQPYFIGTIDVTIQDFDKNIISEKIPILNYSSSTYPQLVYFHKGEAVEIYKGKHNKNDIYTYIKRKIYVESIQLNIYETFESKITHDKNAFIFFGFENTTGFDLYKKLSKEKLDTMFYHSSEDIIFNKLNPKRNSTLIYYAFGKQRDTLFNLTSTNINKFLKKNLHVNMYDKVSEEFINEVIMKKHSALILFRNQYENNTQYLEENFPLIARGESSLKFLVTDLTGKYDLKLARLLNVGIKDIPALRIIDFKEGLKRYELTRELSMENVMNFIKSWKENKLHHYIVSQSPSKIESKKKEIVKKINIANFYESVIFNRKNVVVLFHASWCTHCKRV